MSRVPSLILAAAEAKAAKAATQEKGRNRTRIMGDRSASDLSPPITTKRTTVWPTTTANKSNTQNVLSPDLDATNRFLGAFGGEKVFTFQTFADRAELKTKRFDPLARVFHGTLSQHAADLTRLNQAGAGVFFMVNQGDGVVHEGSKTCRTTANVIAVRAMFVDLDGSPLEPLLDSAQPPHIIIESSPGRWHGYWLDIDCPLERFKPIQQALVRKFNSDPNVVDLPRVMRLPGFFHQKYDPFMTRIVKLPAKALP